MRYLNQGIMILIAVRTLFHCALTAKITETISDGNYIVECNHLQDKWSLTYIFCPYCPWIMLFFSHRLIVKQPWINVLMQWSRVLFKSLIPALHYCKLLWQHLAVIIIMEEQQKSCSILTATPWGPSGPGNPVSPIGPLSPCQKTETADVSVGSDKGMTRGLTAQRELEAAAHRLSWDPWLATSAGLPLSIKNIGREELVFDRPSIVSYLQHLSSLLFIIYQSAYSCTENPQNGQKVYIPALKQSSIVLWDSVMIAAILCTLWNIIDLLPAAD